MKEATAIVAPAPAVEFDGIQKLAKAIHGEWAAQRKAQDSADAHGLEIGRLICEFAKRPQVAAQLAVINAKKNGRPQAAHCYVAEQLIVSGEVSSLSQRHLERCARAFQKAQKKGLPIGTAIKIAEASDIIKKVAEKSVEESTPSPERLFNTEPNETASEENKFDPDVAALKLARSVRSFFYDDSNNPRLRTKAQKDAFAKKLDEAFSELGIEWAIYPKAKGE